MMTSTIEHRMIDLTIGSFAGILSKKRSRKRLTHKAITTPPANTSTRATGSEEIEKAALYSAEMGDTEITKSIIQKAAPPAAANISSFFENSREDGALL